LPTDWVLRGLCLSRLILSPAASAPPPPETPLEAGSALAEVGKEDYTGPRRQYISVTQRYNSKTADRDRFDESTPDATLGFGEDSNQVDTSASSEAIRSSYTKAIVPFPMTVRRQNAKAGPVKPSMLSTDPQAHPPVVRIVLNPLSSASDTAPSTAALKGSLNDYG
jgi:hypothetical protein